MCRIDEHITKQCRVCEQSKPIEQFKRCGKTKAGNPRHDTICKECQKVKDTAYRAGLNQEQQARYKDLFYKHNKAKSDSRPQKTDIWFHECSRCGAVRLCKEPPKHKRCPECIEYLKAYKKAEPLFPVGSARECIECGGLFKVESKGKALCSEECLVIRQKRWERKYKNQIGRSHESRARKAGVLVMYNIKSLKVFQRDKWRCQMCGCKVQKKDIYADNAAEIDHIVPISKGGPHTYSNVQTLCRKCNNHVKGSEYVGQLVLAL